jgi:hypothetical protein
VQNRLGDAAKTHVAEGTVTERYNFQTHLVASGRGIAPEVALTFETAQDVRRGAGGNIEMGANLGIGQPARFMRYEFKDGESTLERIGGTF